MEREIFEIDHIEEDIVTITREDLSTFNIPIGLLLNLGDNSDILKSGLKLIFNDDVMSFALAQNPLEESVKNENTQNRFDKLKKKK